MAKIGVFDSGVGGLSVLRELIRELPAEEYVYFADSAYCPYGGRTPEYVTARAHAISDILISKSCDIIVVACNTATSAAITSLRESYAIPFVGMEPAIKPAALETCSGVIGVLATEGTLKGSKYLDMKDKFSEGVTVLEHTGCGFVELVERRAASASIPSEKENAEILNVVRRSLKPLIEAGADTIVLGCTHYPFLLPQLQQVAAELSPGRTVRFIDPAPAIARRVRSILSSDGESASMLSSITNSAHDLIYCKQKPEPQIELLSSGSVETLSKAYRHLLA